MLTPIPQHPHLRFVGRNIFLSVPLENCGCWLSILTLLTWCLKDALFDMALSFVGENSWQWCTSRHLLVEESSCNMSCISNFLAAFNLQCWGIYGLHLDNIACYWIRKTFDKKLPQSISMGISSLTRPTSVKSTDSHSVSLKHHFYSVLWTKRKHWENKAAFLSSSGRAYSAVLIKKLLTTKLVSRSKNIYLKKIVHVLDHIILYLCTKYTSKYQKHIANAKLTSQIPNTYPQIPNAQPQMPNTHS